MLKLYLCDVTDLPEEPGDLPLSDYRLRRLGVLRPSLARRLSIGVELLLIHALRDTGETLSLPLDIRVTLAGKPQFAEGRYQFSLSHSGRYAACALCDRPVGLDIQVQRPADERFLQRFLSPDEQRFIHEAADSQAAFCEVWTRKESYLKATGTGIRAPLADFSCFRLPESFSAWHDDFQGGRPHIATCVEGEQLRPGSCEWVDAKELLKEFRSD